MRQSARSGSSLSDLANPMSIVGNCINYPFKSSESYRYFLLSLTASVFEETTEDDYSFENCSLEYMGSISGTFRIKVFVNNSDDVAYIKFKGFIIAVFNYTT